MNHKHVAIDFDGTIHNDYDGWRLGGEIYGEPLPGAKESIDKLIELGYYITIYSCRTSQEVMGNKAKEQEKLLKDWLNKYNIRWHEVYMGNGKPVAKLYIDDRAWHFTTWNHIDQIIERLNK